MWNVWILHGDSSEEQQEEKRQADITTMGALKDVEATAEHEDEHKEQS